MSAGPHRSYFLIIVVVYVHNWNKLPEDVVNSKTIN